MTKITAKEMADITTQIGLGFTPAGMVADVVDLAKAIAKLYKNKNDENYFDVALCLIAFIPGAGDGIKAGFRIVNKRPEILFDLLSMIIEEYNKRSSKKIYGNPETWLDNILNRSYINGLINKAKKEALAYNSQKNSNQFLKYWIDQSILGAFNILETLLPSVLSVIQAKVRKWKRHVPKSSARVLQPTTNKTTTPANKTTYSKTTGSKGTSNANQSKKLSRTDIKNKLKVAEIGAVGEHMADYWVAEQIGINIKPIHDKTGQKPKKRLYRTMTKLSLGVNDQGIDGVWQTDGKRLGKFTSKKYAIIEAKATIKDTMYPSVLGKVKNTSQTTKPSNTKKGGRGSGSSTNPTSNNTITADNYQMSKDWVKQRLIKIGLQKKVGSNYSRHLLGFSLKTPATENHMQLLAQILMSHAINDKEHEPDHTPTFHWTDADIDKSINTRVANANKPKTQAKQAK
ncbi:hypothetical protein LP123_02055 [Moraxella bovis]|uniref:hypothetical protein n=2 Tax=Moraxella bovis TaxID=476 RepID=UPI0022268CF1|nr:hypothetical protein [Moraxella bovis]UYZ81559.1 hypothetical protein LP113_02070 [Moraxella bovis]UYZ95741.1 hypothetical protein LP121_04055 [Moraxella bovis]UYZ95744.1 hypothetical protein LP121_04070 [Moraxella bovis]UZA05881.1 hypothetical protein LP099_12265 [Moraxella bovis]UZA11891.1 hypothetical protein LP123_02055 [Moraxella bovis]